MVSAQLRSVLFRVVVVQLDPASRAGCLAWPEGGAAGGSHRQARPRSGVPPRAAASQLVALWDNAQAADAYAWAALTAALDIARLGARAPAQR